MPVIAPYMRWVGVVLGVHSDSFWISAHAAQNVLKSAALVVDAFGAMFVASLTAIFSGYFLPAVHPIQAPLPIRMHPSTTIATILNIFFLSSFVIGFSLP
jgi:hypothetical protein